MFSAQHILVGDLSYLNSEGLIEFFFGDRLGEINCDISKWEIHSVWFG